MVESAAQTSAAEPSVTVTEALAIDIAAVAVLLGVSKSTAKEWDNAGLLPAAVIREGKVVRWSKVELSAWILAGCPHRVLWSQSRDMVIRKFLAARGAA